MSNIFYTAAEIKYQDAVRAFMKKEIAPNIAVMDRENKYPYDELKKLGKKGYIGVRFPEKYGGSGKDLVSETIVNEETGALSIALACARSVPTYVAQSIHNYGSEAIRQKYLASIFNAETIVSECVTEPEAGSDALRMRTTAVSKGSHYILTGAKRFMASGAIADLFLVYAISNPAVHPSQGLSAILVERERGDIFFMREFETLGYRGLEIVSQLTFKRTRVPKENLLGKENEGFEVLMDMLDIERTIVAASVIGAARSCLETAVKYSQERQTFHRPLREFEAISFGIADMATGIEAARLLRIKAARLIDQGKKATKEAAMAKLLSTETAFQVTHQAMQILGGIGYTTDYPIERHFRDSRAGLFVGGSSEMMKLIIQREIYGEFPQPKKK